jgi:acyl carrier protein
MDKKILKIINEIKLNKGEDELLFISENDLLREDIGLDSFDLAELTVHIEVEFDIDIFNDGNITSIQDIYKKLK